MNGGAQISRISPSINVHLRNKVHSLPSQHLLRPSWDTKFSSVFWKTRK